MMNIPACMCVCGLGALPSYAVCIHSVLPSHSFVFLLTWVWISSFRLMEWLYFHSAFYIDVVWFLGGLSLIFVSICISQPFPLHRFVQAPITDCPPSQSLRRHSRETRPARAGCLYHVYLCSSRVSFLPSFHLLPPFIACNISWGLTG